MPGYRLAVTFVDGSKGVVDLSLLVEREDAGLFTALREPSFFARAYLELGVVTWPNGADLDPAWMHEEINDKGVWRIGTKRGRS